MKPNTRLKLIQGNEPIGPSLRFLRLTRNPALRSPVRFEPTVKRDGDLVL